MDYFTDKFGFESDDIEAVTGELARATKLKAEPHSYEGFGGDYSAFGNSNDHGGQLSLYTNRFHDGIEPDIHEENFPELGLVLLIEQQGEYVDYKPIFKELDGFESILLYRDRYLAATDKSEVVFDLAKEQSKSP